MAHDHTVAPATAQEYNTALLAAETNPDGMTQRQKNLLSVMAKEVGARGNRARAALGQG